MRICNIAGEAICEVGSDTEAARWFLESGRTGDYLDDTGELMSYVCVQLGLVDEVRFGRDGCVVTPERVLVD